MMFEFLKEYICRDLPKPISREQRQRDQKRIIRHIVSVLSRGNLSLQQGLFITEEDINRFREENLKHDFCKK